MTGKFFINDNDAFVQWGLVFTRGIFNALLKFPKRKTLESFSWKDENGTERNVAAVFESMNLALPMAIIAGNESDFWFKYKAFYDFVKEAGYFKLRSEELDVEMNLMYLDMASFEMLSDISESYPMGCSFDLLVVNDFSDEVETEPAVRPAAPTGGTVNDTDNLFTFALNPEFTVTQHEYTFNSGFSWYTLSPEMDNEDGTATIPVENISLSVGSLRVRVKAIDGNLAGYSLSNTVAFTVPGGSTQPLAPINGVVDDIANTFAFKRADITYSLTDHQFRYKPIGGSFTTWINCTSANTEDNSNGNYLIYTIPESEIAIGDVQVRVRAFGSNPPGLVLSSSQPYTVAPVPLYNIFIKSDGNDANDGLSESTPVATLPRLMQVANAYSGNPGIKFLDEHKYRSSLRLPLDDITLDANYSTFDSGDVVPKNVGAWTQPDAVTYPNVWKTSWVLDMTASEGDFMREGVSMTVDEVMPTVRKTLADVNANVGSFHMPDSFKLPGMGIAHPVIDIYVNTGTNPNTDSKVYEIMTRYQGLSLGANSTVTGLITQTQVSNDGSTKVGTKTILRKSLFAHGHKHSVFTESGMMEDCIAFDAEYDPTAAPVIAFMDDAAGENLLWRRVMIIIPDNKIFNSSGFYGHPIIEEPLNEATQYNNWTIEQCLVDGATSIGGLYATGIAVYRNNYGRCLSLDGTSMDTTLDRSIFNPKAHGAGSIRGIANIRNCVYYIAYGLYNSVYQMDTNNPSGLILDRCTFAGPAPERQTNDTYLAEQADYNFSHCIFLLKGINVTVPDDGSTYTGDYNIFYTNSSPSDNARFNWHGTSLNTLALWQAASGQDANSVYVTATQRNIFFLNDPATGDFRINPNAKVTGADGTVYTGQFPDGTPLSAAGAQEHWNYNTRTVEAGPCQRFPYMPLTKAECISYIKNPESWNFYP